MRAFPDRDFSVRRPVTAEFLLVSLVLAWVLGFYVGDLARLVTILLFSSLLLVARLGAAGQKHACLRGNYSSLSIVFVALIVSQQAFNYLLGLQGLDFAIFAQAIESVPRRGDLYTSFIWDGWIHFLTHHFSPILYISGLLGFLGLSGAAAAILSHAVAVAVFLYFAFQFCRAIGFSAQLSGFLVFLICLNPTLRVALAWEVRDEILALPFVALVYNAWLRGRPIALLLGLILCCSCKETFFIFSFLVGACLLLWKTEHQLLQRKFRIVAIAAIFLGAVGATIYFKFLWVFAAPSFNPQGRIASISELLAAPALLEKLKFLAIVLAPSLGFGLTTKRGLILATPAFAFVGPILISNFPQMYHRYNYYGVVPSVILAFAAFYSLGVWKPGYKQEIPAMLALALVALSLSFAPFNRPGRLLYRAWNESWVSPRSFDAIPDDAVILADDYTFPFLRDKEHVIRFWLAAQQPVQWDYLVIRRGTIPALPASILDNSAVCLEYPSWIVRCRN